MRAKPLAAAVVTLVVAGLLPASSRAVASGGLSLRLAPNASSQNTVSANWSGYAVAGDATVSYRAVSGAWVQPAATCTPGKIAYAAFWVGLGGFTPGSQALEQIGTSTDCSAAGKPEYSAWYELVPSPAVPIKLKLAAGDSMSAVVVVSGRNVTLRLKDLTRGTVFTKRVSTRAVDVSSAEWIAEAPSECDASWSCRVLPLSNFGTVTFSHAAAATVGSHSGTISDPTWAATGIELVPGAAATASVDPLGGAMPSELSPDGSSFDVTWRDAAAAG